jgi:hypothetical protein
MFSMQPTVIPFELTFRWFVITMLMLMFVMFVIQWLMKRWASWQSQITLWTKLKDLKEQHQEAASRSREPESEAVAVSYLDSKREGIELQSLGTSVLSTIGVVSPA